MNRTSPAFEILVRATRPTRRTLLAVVCILVIAVCATMIVEKIVGRARIDLTERRMYTLSQGTLNIIGRVNEPIRLKLFYSRVAAMKGPEQIRYYNNYYLYVRDLLEEYASLSGGKLSLDIVDPRPFSDEEEEAMEHGIKRLRLSEDENFFFGLVAQTELGKKEIIPFFEPDRQEFVEYDVSKLISTVVRRETRKVGVLSSLPVTGGDMSPYMLQMLRMQGRTPPPPWTIVTHLRSQYDIKSVAKDVRSIDEDLDFLMLVHPKNLSERTLFAIDQFVMRGGKLLVFVDPHCISDQPTQNQNPYARFGHNASSELNALLKGWGVEMDTKVIAGDRALAVKTQVRRDRIEPLATYMNLTKDCVNSDEVVSGSLHSVKVLFAGVLKRVPGSETTVTPLLTTTATGGTWTPSGPFELQMPNPEQINRALKDGSETLMLACRISGKLKTNFPDGVTTDEKDKEEEDKSKKDPKDKKSDKKDKAPKEPRKLKAVQETAGEATVLVFADVDMIWDGIAYQRQFFGTSAAGDNASVVFNALDFLSGSGDLIAIRSRGRFERPFVVLDEIEAEAERATALEKEAINKKIARYKEDLRKLGASATRENVRLVHNKALAERQKLEEDIRGADRELRVLNAGVREEKDALKAALQWHNMLWAPAAVLLIAVALGLIRATRARRYAARRM